MQLTRAWGSAWHRTLPSMTQLAYVFPGQGSQSVGMGRSLAEISPAAAAVFAAADRALGEPISAVAWDGPAERLDLTEQAQPAILATSIAILAALRERWAAEGLIAPGARLRGRPLDGPVLGPRAPQARSSSTTRSGSCASAAAHAGVRAGARRRDGRPDRARRLALAGARRERRAHGVFVVANRNAPGQVVVSGERAAVEAGAALAKEIGAKRAIVLPVSVAAHSPLMAAAAAGMQRALAGVTFRDPVTRLLANADARPIETADGCRAELVEHLTAGVDWIAIVERMTAAGVTTFVEIGPGKVLTGLVRRIAPDAEVIAADDPASVDRLMTLASVPA